jgi:hypothetical protein
MVRAIPIDVLLSFPNPNYTDPVTHGASLVIVNCVFISLVTIFVALRLYTRLYLKRWFGIDDWCIILSWIFTVGLTTVVILANQKYYWNRHVWDVPIDGIAASEKVVMAAKILFTCACSFTRMSLICFYYRIVGDARRKWFRWLLHASMAYIIAIFTSFIILTIWQCT